MFAPCPKRYCCIATDDFDRADADDPGADWDELQIGDADISGNTLLMAATPLETVIRFQTAHPGGANAAARVKVRFMLDDLADVCGVLMSGDGTAVDMSPFCQVLIQQTGSCNELFLQGPNGLETSVQRLPGLTANEWHTLEVCFDPGDTSSSPEVAHVMRAIVKLANGRIYGDQLEITSLSNHTLGAYVGLRGYAGTKFDDFYFGWASYDDACHKQCPTCNTPCPIEEDEFTRADSSDLGCKWIELSGGWEITFNALTCNAAGIALCAVHHPQDKSHQRVTASIVVDVGRTTRIVINSTANASSHHWAELSYDGGPDELTLSIGKDGATLDSVVSQLAAGDTVVVTVCYDGFVLSAFANGTIASAESDAVAEGHYAGVQGIHGAEFILDFKFEKHWSFADPQDLDCPTCDEGLICSSCLGDTPQYMIVDLGALTSILPPPSLCSDTWCETWFSGSHLVAPFNINCVMVKEFVVCPGGFPDNDTMEAVLRVTIGTNSVLVEMEISRLVPSFVIRVAWEKEYPDGVPCGQFNREPIPLTEDSAAGCDWLDFVYLTAVP